MNTITQGTQVPMRVDPQSTPTATGGGSVPHPMFRALQIAATGLSAQRARLEVAAQNIANAETTRTPEGGPYRRMSVILESNGITPMSALDPNVADASKSGIGAPSSTDPYDDQRPMGVRVAGVTEDGTPGPMIYDPAHPDADANGYVHMPNVSITDEMMEMMDARRVYDANATVFQAAKTMLHRALDI